MKKQYDPVLVDALVHEIEIEAVEGNVLCPRDKACESCAKIYAALAALRKSEEEGT